MNERLKELAEQAGLSKEFSVSGLWLADDQELERFADLVRQDYLREIKALKPVAMIDHSHPFSDDSVYMIANYERSLPSGTKLYALEEVKDEPTKP